MARIAVVDVGTNSVKLTIADADNGKLNLVEETSSITRLGEGVDQSQLLLPAAMDRTLAAAQGFIEHARSLGAKSIAATGTSALRDARNGPDFRARFHSGTGISMEIIAGAREAELGFKSVLHDESLHLQDDKPLLVFDIGGGSTELICGRSGRLIENDSLNIGAVRLTERHLTTDPPGDEEFERAWNDASAALAGFTGCRSERVQVVGIGGTAVTLAAIVSASHDESIGSAVAVQQLRQAVDQLRALPLALRKKVEGLEPARADIIIGGAVILLSLLEQFGADSYQPSVRGMRYGLLAELAEC